MKLLEINISVSGRPTDICENPVSMISDRLEIIKSPTKRRSCSGFLSIVLPSKGKIKIQSVVVMQEQVNPHYIY